MAHLVEQKHTELSRILQLQLLLSANLNQDAAARALQRRRCTSALIVQTRLPAGRWTSVELKQHTHTFNGRRALSYLSTAKAPNKGHNTTQIRITNLGLAA
jgi:hypothetical protein